MFLLLKHLTSRIERILLIGSLGESENSLAVLLVSPLGKLSVSIFSHNCSWVCCQVRLPKKRWDGSNNQQFLFLFPFPLLFKTSRKLARSVPSPVSGVLGHPDQASRLIYPTK